MNAIAKAKLVIELTGDWCNGYYWQIISCGSGRTLKESGPYHATLLAEPKRVAAEDALEWAQRNDLEIVRHP